MRRHRRRDLVVSYLGMNVGVMAVAVVLSGSAAGIGLGLGRLAGLGVGTRYGRRNSAPSPPASTRQRGVPAAARQTHEGAAPTARPLRASWLSPFAPGCQASTRTPRQKATWSLMCPASDFGWA
ncbi:MAG: DUF4956 domain-containing protein [Arthrobacter sp.]|nr:DUF4956 domain-containing protein [Arthrobacter sp.]MDZ4352666.1 DUF4956 domain-containing protein [Arthrobacter sp.]